MTVHRLPRNRARARFESYVLGDLRYSRAICSAVDAAIRERRRQWAEVAIAGLIIVACCAWLALALEGLA